MTVASQQAEQFELPAVMPVGSVQQVLAALADPVRLEMVRRMAADGSPVACGRLYEGISKSTASHHFKILREAGLTERVVIGGQTHQLLRTAEVDAALPGVLAAVVAAATTQRPEVPQHRDARPTWWEVVLTAAGGAVLVAAGFRSVSSRP